MAYLEFFQAIYHLLGVKRVWVVEIIRCTTIVANLKDAAEFFDYLNIESLLFLRWGT